MVGGEKLINKLKSYGMVLCFSGRYLDKNLEIIVRITNITNNQFIFSLHNRGNIRINKDRVSLKIEKCEKEGKSREKGSYSNKKPQFHNAYLKLQILLAKRRRKTS